jgi:hypothetical protein
VFTLAEDPNVQPSGTVALYCGEGCWGTACDQFCRAHLGLSAYERLVLLGGPACLSPHHQNAVGLCDAALEQLSFVVQTHRLERVILIAHAGCSYYTMQPQREREDCLPRQLADLDAAATTLRGWFSGVRVESYLAVKQGGTLAFHDLKS